MFHFDVTKRGDHVTVVLQGRLDAIAAASLHEEMTGICSREVTSITFDAKKLEYISSSGLRVILMARQRLGADGTLYLKDASEGVRTVMELTGFSDFVEMI